MFDIGFWELITITIITLLVVGPQQLPRFARDAGHIIGKIRHFIHTTRYQLKKELEFDEINQLDEDINHVDHLMTRAPDRFVSGNASVRKDKQSER